VKTINQELESIFNSSYDEIYVTDGRGVTLKVNNAVYKNCNLPADYFVGRNVEELEKEGYFSPSATKKALESRNIVTVRSVTNTGQQLVTTATPIFNEAGEIVRVICNVRNITELFELRKRLEETECLVHNYRLELAKLDEKRAKIDEIIGVSKQILEVRKMIFKVADLDSIVLITGESGVGKGIVARAIHANGRRAQGPFISVNCGAIPENLVESELFGYEAGAFTGARKEGKKGLVELADGGTLFLDEVAELPLNLQVKLLTFIQERKFMRVGGSKERKVDVRIIAASNKSLAELVERGEFREDLYYRLNVIPIHIPPLRSRREDIIPLVEHIMRKLNQTYQTFKKLQEETLQIITDYDWPGNVRELENVLERVLVTSDNYQIGPEHLPEHMRSGGKSMPPGIDGGKPRVLVEEICTLEEAINEVERQLLEKARSLFHSTPKMAKVLGVNQSTVVRKLRRYSIS